ncbi:MAG: hypothetical protein ABFS43_20040 [Thermodesulfobacteriota bacterium]
MKPNNVQTGSNRKTPFWYLYLVSIIMLAFSGFGQMPLYKRYYISDIPGMAWAADFYVTHLIHYVFSALLLGIAFYALFNHLLIGKKINAITSSGYVRVVIVAGLLVSGLVLAVYNFSGVSFPMWASATLLFTHLGFAMALIVTGIIAIIGKKPWIVSR